MPQSKPKDRSAWWYDARKRGLLVQIIIVILTLWALVVIFSNTTANLEARGIKTSFSFMSDVAPFSIPLNFSPFWDFKLGESKYWEIFVIGIQNTLLIALLGIPSATLLGIVLGILRLSPNALVRGAVGAYIEFFRNTPLLLQLMLWAFALFPIWLAHLPPVNESIFIGDAVFNRAGFYLPMPILDVKAISIILLWLVAIISAIWAVKRHAKKVRDNAGNSFPVLWTSIGILILAGLIFYFVVAQMIQFDLPVKKGINYSGGMRPPFQLIILWFGLVIYTAAFIAECVRGGMMSVNPGQSEAAMAIGLERSLRIRLIILPQALRVIIPPSISQFLNLTKNSSLAVAVGYPDITNIWAGIALNQTGQSLIILGLTLVVYEILSLTTAGLTYLYESKVQIKEK